MRVPQVDLSPVDNQVQDEVLEALRRLVAAHRYILGPMVEAFEKHFAEYCGVRFAVGVASGTDALEIALRACGIGAGDEVILPAFTYIATATAVLRAGARPVLVDVEKEAALIDISKVESAIGPRTRALLPVHLYGRLCDMSTLLTLARRSGLKCIEDACQAHGASVEGKRAGSWGDAAAFSFYPSKNLGAWGDGGCVTTDSDQIYRQSLKIRNHGSTEKYRHECFGFTGRLDALQAAVLDIKLKYLEDWNRSRRQAAALYRERIRSADPLTVPEGGHVYHQYVTRSPRREALREFLKKRGIETALHYPQPLHLVPALSHLGYPRGSFPVAEQLSQEVLSLPMFAGIKEEEIEYVSKTLNEFAGSGE